MKTDLSATPTLKIIIHEINPKKYSVNNDGKLEIQVLKDQESYKIKSFVTSNVWGLFKNGQAHFKKGEFIECYSPTGSNINIFS